MEQNSPAPPKRFWNLPVYLGRTAFFLALVPLAMMILCVVTHNTVYSLIDLYYCFVTPMQVCKWSLILALIFSVATNISARVSYSTGDNSSQDDIYNAIRLSMYATALVILEIAIYQYNVTFL